jgi:hypothetical protein
MAFLTNFVQKLKMYEAFFSSANLAFFESGQIWKILFFGPGNPVFATPG